MHDLVRVIFHRLETLDPDETAVEGDESAMNSANTELRMNVSPTREAATQSLDQVLDVETEAPEREKTPVPVVHDGESTSRTFFDLHADICLQLRRLACPP
jgi:hypothetical protein